MSARFGLFVRRDCLVVESVLMWIVAGVDGE